MDDEDAATDGADAATADAAAADASKALVSAAVKKRKLYRQTTGTEVPWFPRDNDIELLKELCHEAGKPRWVCIGTPAEGCGHARVPRDGVFRLGPMLRRAPQEALGTVSCAAGCRGHARMQYRGIR